MNILLLSHSRNDPDAGASRVYHQLQEGLSARGHVVETLHFEDFRLPRPRLLSTPVEKLAMPHWIDWRQRRRNLAQVDVVMAPSGMGHRLFRRLRDRPGRPLLVNHQHGLTLFDHQARVTEAMAGHIAFPLHKRLLERIPMAWDMAGLRSADLTILQNLRDFDYLRRHDEAARLTVIPPALLPAILAASATAPSPASRQPHSLVWFGSWVARKGAAVVPAAFDQVVDAVPDATLTIGGTGLSERDVLSHFSARARLRVHVLPRLSLADQLAEMQRHAVFLFPSLSEGFGLALLEAMALGLLAVTTLTGFCADFLRQRETALVVPQASARHLADGILEALRDDTSRIAMAQRGQSLARTFTLERMATDYEAAFTTGLTRLRARQPPQSPAVQALPR
jgi:glycosyltransferase involved in cell wall biosynthesis